MEADVLTSSNDRSNNGKIRIEANMDNASDIPPIPASDYLPTFPAEIPDCDN